MSTTDIWPAPYAEQPVSGVVRVPGSKSLTNRYLVLAAVAGTRTVIHRPLVSRDTTLMRAALARLGVPCETSGDDDTWVIEAPAGLRCDVAIDVGLAGTVMRFLPPVAALVRGAVTFDGDAAARTRPIAPLVQGLRALGVDVEDSGDPHLPITVRGSGAVRGGLVTIDASTSSQFVSALLLAGARFTEGLTLRHTGAGVPSRPHIEMTLQTLAQFGVTAGEPEPGLWRVEPGEVTGAEVTVEPDLSSAAPFLALAAVTGGTITVADWPSRTTQAGDAMRSVLEAMGAHLSQDDRGLRLTGPAVGQLDGIDVDLHDVGELTPVVAAVAAQARTPSRLRGVAHLRGHESDRLQALTNELSRMGSDVTATQDGLEIRPARLSPARLQTYHDHRMAMAAAVLGAGVRGVGVVDVATTAKTYPGFAQAWSELVH